MSTFSVFVYGVTFIVIIYFLCLYTTNKSGSPGLSPSGGMRQSFSIPAETDVGYWGITHQPNDDVLVDIYDNTNQHVEYITPIGHWS